MLMENFAKEFERLKPLQEKECEIVEYIDELCQKHHITYCLAYGSALGAQRHKGPIPWDDDMDIYMFASEYEKFEKIFQSEGDKERFYLQSRTIKGMRMGVPKLRLNGTTFIQETQKNMDMHQGIYVDIFLLEYCPPTAWQRIKCILANDFLTLKKLSFDHYKKRKIVAPILWVLRKLPHSFGMKSALKQLHKYGNNSSDMLADWGLYTGNPKYFISKDIIFPVVRQEYAGHQFCVPHDIEKYLEICYGNWKEVPKIDAIAWSQHAAQWSTTEDFRKYCPNIKDFSDEKTI